MGIRIDIKWNFISPALGCISGVIEIWQINNEFSYKTYYPNKLILECKCKKDRHSIGFSSIDSKGISTKIFGLFNNTLKTMIDSYYKGLMLDNHMFHWMEDDLISDNISFEEWAKTEGYENDITQLKIGA